MWTFYRIFLANSVDYFYITSVNRAFTCKLPHFGRMRYAMRAHVGSFFPLNARLIPPQLPSTTTKYTGASLVISVYQLMRSANYAGPRTITASTAVAFWAQ